MSDAEQETAKTCSRCKVQPRHKKGCYCKACQKIVAREYYLAHHEEVLAKQKAYGAQHKEQAVARAKAWYEEHKDMPEYKERRKQWKKHFLETHPNYNKDYQEKNCERLKAYRSEYRRRDEVKKRHNEWHKLDKQRNPERYKQAKKRYDEKKKRKIEDAWQSRLSHWKQSDRGSLV